MQNLITKPRSRLCVNVIVNFPTIVCSCSPVGSAAEAVTSTPTVPTFTAMRIAPLPLSGSVPAVIFV